MAVAMSGTDRVDYGDVATISGLTAITCAFTFKPSAATSNLRLMSQWGGTNAKQALLVLVQDTDELAFIVRGNSSDRFGKKTVGLNFVSGTQYRCMLTWSAGAPNVIEIWINGVKETGLVTFVDATDQTTIWDVSTALQLGHETDETANGEPGDYSEFAVWDHKVPDWVAEAYGRGFSPNIHRKGGLIYDKLWGLNSVNEWGGDDPTHTGTSLADHPSVVQMAVPLNVLAAAAAAAGSFAPYYYEHLLAGAA